MSTNTIQQALDTWLEFWNGYDLDQIDQLYDEQLTYFSSETEGLMQGREQLRAQHVGFGFVPGGKESPNLLSLEGVVVQPWGEGAVVSAIWCFRRGGPGGREQRGPCTLVLAWDGERYRFIHTHFSNYAPRP